MQLGQADDQWVLDQARGEGVGPRALCVLVEERRARRRQPGEGNPDYDEMIIAELVHIASNRFEDGGQFDLDTLEYWGKLWLSLGAGGSGGADGHGDRQFSLAVDGFGTSAFWR